MRERAISVFALAFSFLSVSMPLFGHHGTAAFDTSKTLTMKGIVTEWDWSNPHCLLQFDIKNEGGQVVHWIAETQNPAKMVNSGWRKATFKPGDEVTVTLVPARNGQPFGQINLVVLPNGETLDAKTESATRTSAGSTGGSKSENYPKQ
ncbi:MAG TPA: DUF6152 family protein [Candidatus Acidoferrales bacterium]|nr:DUF6152 family protein [Candidatus Acidoferrales bacterium]